MDLTRRQREIISRATMVIVGVLLLAGAFKSCSAAGELRQDAMQRTDDVRNDSSGLPALIGVVCFGLGGFLTVAGLLPSRVLEAFSRS